MGGGDKALLPLGAGRVLDHVIARLAPQVGSLALNANGDPSRFAAYGLPVLPDPIGDHPGPLAGVLAGMEWAAGEGASAILTVAADTPFFPLDLADGLMAATAESGAPIALAATLEPAADASGEMRTMRHPTFGLWSVALRDDLRRALEDGVRKIVAWTDTHGAASALFDADGGVEPFFNLNTPEDMVRAEAMLAAVAR